jgi:hypothetical protein
MKQRLGRRILAAFALTISAATCGEPVTPVNGTGATRTLLTDGPFPYDRVSRVDLYIVRVSASLSPDTSARTNGSFVTLATPNRRINVLALQNGTTEELGAVNIPTGAIQAVQMVIDTDSSSITLANGTVLTGKSTPGIAWQSSAGRPVLNALIHEQILVPDSGATIVIDYDVGKAFIPPQAIDPASTDQGFIFSPVLSAIDKARSSSIAGTVRAKDATGVAVPNASLRLYLGDPNAPEDNWATIATAKTDANGVFRFAYIPVSGSIGQAGWTYMVAADPPSTSNLGRRIIKNVVAAKGTETGIGIVILP